MATASIPVTGDPAADGLLTENPLALLIGMLLDQQVPMEWAFKGPYTLNERLGGLDATAIAAMDPDELEAVFKTKPALHRFPGSMAKRTHALAQVIVDEYGGDAAAIWTTATHRRRTARAAPGAAGLRRGEVEDLPRAAGEATRRAAAGLGGGRDAVLRLDAAIRRRHRLRREPRPCPRVEAGAEGEGQEEVRLRPCGASFRPESAVH